MLKIPKRKVEEEVETICDIDEPVKTQTAEPVVAKVAEPVEEKVFAIPKAEQVCNRCKTTMEVFKKDAFETVYKCPKCKAMKSRC
ncbi:MAG: hypothetical protein WC444_06845 [Candidatus Paceibacterota bacterium]